MASVRDAVCRPSAVQLPLGVDGLQVEEPRGLRTPGIFSRKLFGTVGISLQALQRESGAFSRAPSGKNASPKRQPKIK